MTLTQYDDRVTDSDRGGPREVVRRQDGPRGRIDGDRQALGSPCLVAGTVRDREVEEVRDGLRGEPDRDPPRELVAGRCRVLGDVLEVERGIPAVRDVPQVAHHGAVVRVARVGRVQQDLGREVRAFGDATPGDVTAVRVEKAERRLRLLRVVDEDHDRRPVRETSAVKDREIDPVLPTEERDGDPVDRGAVEVTPSAPAEQDGEIRPEVGVLAGRVVGRLLEGGARGGEVGDGEHTRDDGIGHVRTAR